MTHEEAARRIAELEDALRREREAKELYRQSTLVLMHQLIPYEPVTDAELDMMVNDTSGTPILDIIVEFERSNP